MDPETRLFTQTDRHGTNDYEQPRSVPVVPMLLGGNLIDDANFALTSRKSIPGTWYRVFFYDPSDGSRFFGLFARTFNFQFRLRRKNYSSC